MMACYSDSSASDGDRVSLMATAPKPAALMAYATTAKAKAKGQGSGKEPPRTPAPDPASSSGSRPAYQGPIASSSLPKSKSKSAPKKTPPDPPITKCRECRDFSFKGSTVYTIKKTCRECGHSTTERRQEQYVYVLSPLRIALTKSSITVGHPKALHVYSGSNAVSSFMRCLWNRESTVKLWQRVLRPRTTPL